jgi:hypothetical protein
MAGVTFLSHLEWNLLDSLFVGSLWILFSVCLAGQTHANLYFCECIGRVRLRCPCPYSNASVGWAASARARGSKIDFTSFLTIYLSFTKL